MSNSLIDQAADINTHPDILRNLANESVELARVVAKNPTVPPDVLEALSGYNHDPEILRNVTRNPNTPVEMLMLLGANYPSELINNPVFPLLVLENPHFFQELPVETLRNILLLKDVPEEYLVMAASRDDSEILNIVANHEKAPFVALSQIVNEIKTLEDRYTASQHVKYAGEITSCWDEEFWRAIKEYIFINRIKEREEFLYNIGILDERLLLCLFQCNQFNIATNPETPSRIVELITNASSSEIEAQINSKRNLNVASNLNTPINTLIDFSKGESTLLLASVASNPNSPVFVLEKLARMDNKEIQQAVHNNYNTPASVLKILYKIDDVEDNQENIQQIQDSVMLSMQHYQKYKHSLYLNYLKILDNIRILLLLSNDINNYIWNQLEKITNFDILIALARHPQTPGRLLEHIYTQSSYRKNNSSKLKSIKKTLRVLLARHPHCPIHILLYLVGDDCLEVRVEAITNLKTNFSFYNQQVAYFLYIWEQANNQEAPADILDSIADNRNISLRLAVANNPNTSAETLHKLAFHPNHEVLIAVIKNINTSLETLLRLSRKRKGFFNIRAHAMKALIQKDPIKAGTVIAEFVNSDEPTSPRFIFLLHQRAPAKFLEQHSNSLCWIERYAIAQNKSTPKHVLSQLATDVNRLVRAVALHSLS
ncbi:hypothetical protein CAL7716_058020 [Calothrix sp. PCC 7716]|nr:hypothetical protein CAL7716_058020 [Calothrix sp. PCC 7716]